MDLVLQYALNALTLQQKRLEKTPDEIHKEKKREYYRKYNLENNEKLKEQKRLLRQKKKLLAEKADAKKAEKHTETEIERHYKINIDYYVQQNISFVEIKRDLLERGANTDEILEIQFRYRKAYHKHYHKSHSEEFKTYRKNYYARSKSLC